MHNEKESLAIDNGEQGYILVGVIIMVAVVMISLAVAVPKIRDDIRRDHEIETMRRGQQYIRAVQLYYRRFHRFPPNIEALVDTDGNRFLRKRYSDPLTGTDDWKVVVLGQNHAPLSMGFFGQVRNVGAAVLAQNGTAGTNGIVGTPPATAFDSFGDSFGHASLPGQSNSLGSSKGAAQDPGPTLPQVQGGAGMIGVSPSLEESSILVYKTKSRYDQWEFVYDPMVDRMLQTWPMPVGGQPPNRGVPGTPLPEQGP
jgi:type II secretory pathway pseudopilin PulG